MDKSTQVFIKVVGRNNREYLVSPEQVKIGDVTLEKFLSDFNSLKQNHNQLKNKFDEQEKKLKNLSNKVDEMVSFSEES